MIITKTLALAASIVWIGIDVSKKTLDAAIWIGGKQYRHVKVDNDADGFSKLLAWAKAACGDQSELRFCMESTGDYGVMAAMYFAELGYHVSVVNPARVRDFAKGEGRINKTDKADAKLIAEYAVKHAPKVWLMQDETRREFFRLARRRLQIVDMIGMEKNRRECPEAIGKACMNSIKTILKALRAEKRELEAALAAIIEKDPAVNEQAKLLSSLSVLKQASIVTILTEMPPVEDAATAANYAAAAGGHATCKQSGTTGGISAPMSRGGRKYVRRCLYMTVLSAIRRVPEIQDLYQRLRLRGRKHRQAMVACIRKLLMIVYGILKHRKPYKSRTENLILKLNT